MTLIASVGVTKATATAQQGADAFEVTDKPKQLCPADKAVAWTSAVANVAALVIQVVELICNDV